MAWIAPGKNCGRLSPSATRLRCVASRLSKPRRGASASHKGSRRGPCASSHRGLDHNRCRSTDNLRQRPARSRRWTPAPVPATTPAATAPTTRRSRGWRCRGATNTIAIFFQHQSVSPSASKTPPDKHCPQAVGTIYGVQPVDCGDSAPVCVRLRCSTLYDRRVILKNRSP
jgi:hypothetical protein